MPKELEAKIAALPQLREELSQAEASSSMAHVRLCMRMFFDVWVARLDVASLTLFHDIDGTSCRRGCGAVVVSKQARSPPPRLRGVPRRIPLPACRPSHVPDAAAFRELADALLGTAASRHLLVQRASGACGST